MFTDLKIFSKNNNKIEYPSKEWSLNTKIYCLGELNLGLNETYFLNEHSAPRIEKIITFYEGLERNESSKDGFAFSTNFKIKGLGNILISVSKNEGRATIKISSIYETHEIRQEKLEEIKLVKYGNFYNQVLEFKKNILKQILPNTSNPLRKQFIERLLNQGRKSLLNSPIDVGNKVKTILGENVSTVRIGYIVNVNQLENNKFAYRIYTNDKVYEYKTYKEDELSKID